MKCLQRSAKALMFCLAFDIGWDLFLLFVKIRVLRLSLA